MSRFAQRQPVQVRSAVTRERLLDAAIECLIRHGYHGTTTTVVCQHAGLSRGAQLHHFATKDDLLIAAVEHLAHLRFEETATKAKSAFLQADGASVEDRIRGGVDLLWQATFVDDLFFAALELWVAGQSNPSLREQIHRVERDLGRDVSRLFADLFPPEIRETRRGREGLRDVGYLLRGLALTRLIRTNTADEERVLETCRSLLLSAAQAAPSNQ